MACKDWQWRGGALALPLSRDLESRVCARSPTINQRLRRVKRCLEARMTKFVRSLESVLLSSNLWV